MKKYLVAAAAVLMAAFAAPVFAATNPFMDVPMNHWAYDAIGQLAASGVLSGYPDGAYKGKQPTTRYEMASALARALAVVDMTKAGKQDAEMLKRLVVEFKDELDALGVKVDQLDARVAVLEKRLGGWKISGALRHDLDYNSNWNGQDWNVGHGTLVRARLYFERWFGEDESIHFLARIDGQNDTYKPYGGGEDSMVTLREFYAEFPFFGGTVMKVGRYDNDAIELPYYLDGDTPFSEIMEMGTDSWLLDRTIDAVSIQKSFGLGSVYFHVAHPTDTDYGWISDDNAGGAWEIFASGQFQATEQFGIDIGVQAFFGDDASVEETIKLNHAWTIFGGLRFNFNQNIGLKGMYYHQDIKTENAVTGAEIDSESTKAYRVVVDIKQDLLKFTSLWLEYNYLDGGFVLPSGTGALFNDYDFADTQAAGAVADSDLKIWRIAAEQRWNDKWTTFLFYSNYNVEAKDAKIGQYGLGVAYQLNANVQFGLSYSAFSYDDVFAAENDSQIRFRTQVTF